MTTLVGPGTPDTSGAGVGPAELAQRHGLRKVGGRPSFPRYLLDIWKRRHFAFSLAAGRAYSHNTGGYLGQLWAFLTPLLWAALYYFVFKVMLQVDKNMTNFPGFLVTGLFIFRFVSGAMNSSAGSIEKHDNLIASLHFPRALIPISFATTELIEMIPAIPIILALVLIGGDPLQWQMLLFLPMLLLAYCFAIGIGCIAARLVHEVKDLGQVFPFVNRLLLYSSGVMFDIISRVEDSSRLSPEVKHAIIHQPFAVFLELGRSCMLADYTPSASLWWWGIGWGLGTMFVGLLYFWQAEAKYGRT